MSDRQVMEGFPLKTRAFYNRIFWLMWLNLEAYRHGYFDVLLSETEDPITWFRFVEAIPNIKLWLAIDDDIGAV
jgi:hypothetical protein